MIDFFAHMVEKESNDNLIAGTILDSTQDLVYKEAGGRFMVLLQAATNPERTVSADENVNYAQHLVDIVKAFCSVALYAIKNLDSKNGKNNPPKQVRRIEILNVDKDLPENIWAYYQGLIRYGIFIRDHRGKSVRGKAVPRLVLRGSLIPYFRLTFSKRDNIQISWDEFIQLLQNPKEFEKEFPQKWKAKGTVYTIEHFLYEKDKEGER
jgi:hypothetical protein